MGKENITKSVSTEKWEKGKAVIRSLTESINHHSLGRPTLNRKELERNTGFLNHLSMTFEQDMSPFLKGFYLSLNSWTSKRDSQDWKMTDKLWMQYLIANPEKDQSTDVESNMELNIHDEKGCLEMITASPKFADDVRALCQMMNCDRPPVVSLRSKSIVTVVYGFGDASGTGLGSTFTCGSGFTFRIGVWGADESGESSNWREFTNVVESLEEEAKLGNLD